MKVRMNVLSAAVAGLGLASVAGTASAFDVYISSATALRDTMVRALSQYCQAGGTLTERTTNKSTTAPTGSSATTRNLRIYECTLKASDADLNAVGLEGKFVRVYHTVEVNASLGGSIVGVHPIFKEIDMEFVDFPTSVPSSACITSGTVTEPSTASFSYVWTKRICNQSKGTKPQIGVSDTEPTSFVGDNLPAGLVIDATNAALDTQAEVDAWQADLTGFGSNIDGKVAFLAVGFGIIAHNATGVTAISHADASSLMSGNLDDMCKLNPSYAGCGTGPQPITYCRRTKGSGTQASFNSFFLDNPAKSAAGLGGALPLQGGSTGGGTSGLGPNGLLTVVENAATSGVIACVQNNANAVGIISLENAQPAGTRYLAVNGVQPANTAECAPGGGCLAANETKDGKVDGIREEVLIDGSYPYFQEASVQWNTTRTGTGTDQENFAFLIRDRFGSPAITNDLRGVVSLCSWWGVQGLPTPKTMPLDTTQFIMHYTRDNNSGQPPRFCAF